MDNNNLFDKDSQNQNGEQGQFQQQPYQPYQQQPYQPYQQPPYQGNTDLEEPVTFADWMKLNELHAFLVFGRTQ